MLSADDYWRSKHTQRHVHDAANLGMLLVLADSAVPKSAGHV
jgi:hypothetical protein